MIVTLLIYCIPVLIFYKVIKTYRQLSQVPGPFLNKFTNILRLLSVHYRDAHEDQVKLHRKYGDLVRLGPNMISVSGPDYIPQIYGIGKGLIKSDFYGVFQNIVNGQRAASLVAMTDESQHARTKRQIAHAYSLSTLVEFEPLVDSTTKVFLDTLERDFASSGGVNGKKACDLGRWLQFYAFDVIGELTFSKRLGFIETGEDVGDIIHNIGVNFDYFSVLGQMPWLDETFLGKNPLYIKFFAKPVASPILKFAQKLLKERLERTNMREGNDTQSEKKTTGNSNSKPDFLTRFLQIRKESDEPMSDREMLSLLFMNINAGSDTIASTLRAIIYYLITNPSTLDSLKYELDTAYKTGNLTLPCPTWHETQSEHLPYLRAVIKEGLRLNPALSLPLERVVPKEGMALQQRVYRNGPEEEGESPKREDTSTATTTMYIPPNTIIGINPYVLHRHPEIFGDDANEFNPSRWLPRSSSSSPIATNPSNPSNVSNSNPKTKTKTKTKTTTTEGETQNLKDLESNILTFGAGKRTCMGRNIAMLELSKLIPALLMRFDLSLHAPPSSNKVNNTNDSARKNGWKVRNSWVLNHEGLIVDLKLRTPSSFSFSSLSNRS